MAVPPFKVKAIFEYTSTHDDDLKFSVGQIITVTEEEDDDWYAGEYVDDSGSKHDGLFPRNFVEKYEPTAPPRPTRTRTKKEAEPPAPAPAPEPSNAAPSATDASTVPEPAAEDTPSSPTLAAPPPVSVPAPAKPGEAVASPVSPPAAIAAKQSEQAPAPAAPAAKAAPPPKPSAPFAASDPPSSNSFKDRLALFNKQAAPPPMPPKPSGLSGGSGFIKKPFVAPPPSRNAYVPPPSRDVPVTKAYRRDEDPEIKEQQAESQEQAERAGLTGQSPTGGDEEDQPKPLSLKERMALLQRQQQEQAQRHAEAAAKKEKPKRPPKKRTESHEAVEGSAEGDAPPPPAPQRRDTGDTEGKKSMDSIRAPPPHRGSSSKAVPKLESFNDGNEADMSGAGDTTEGQEDLTEQDDSDTRPKIPIRGMSTASIPQQAQADDAEEEEEEEEEEDDDDDIDPEVRRKEELRARMAKMSGGMGFHGMFGPPGMMAVPGPAAPAKKKKAPATTEKESAEAEDEASPTSRAAPPVPIMMALPGMSHKAPAAPEPAAEEEEEEAEEPESESEQTPAPAKEHGAPPPVPGGRPAPPPIPTEARPPPPPPPAVKSPSNGSESDDEMSDALATSQQTPRAEVPPTLRSPPPLPPSLPSPGLPSSARSPPPLPPAAYPGPAEMAPTSPGSNKRNSRPPPPIPGAAAPSIPPAQTRPPPPPPPTANVSRQSTDLASLQKASHDDDEEEEEVTEYEGDYDTDIASSVPHRDALKAHDRESSFEDMTPVRSPVSEAPPSGPPPIPMAAAPRAGPPPIPSQAPPLPDSRRSMDQPRAAPPPPPKANDDDEYDPYNYSAAKAGSSSGAYGPKTPKIQEEQPQFPETSLGFSPPHERRDGAPSGPPPNRAPQYRLSMDPGRRSMDVGRPSMESGFIANDIDLAKQSGWWKQANQVPPVLQGRRDLYFESEESTSTNRGAKTIITRTIYVLFQDYSQTVLTVRLDPYEPADVELEQRHEPPPRTLRQDQLEQSYDRFGSQIAQAVAGKKDSVVGDGTPQGLILELLRPYRDALAPVGTRAYGALVYANMANASTQQHDEIRPGDILSIRNAKFQGKHGAMHAKYSAEVGKPDHVAVVAEWDGTKKKVRAWEQGRESKKVKLESFKLDDLRSGEVKIWRVMPRSWVGWNVQS